MRIDEYRRQRRQDPKYIAVEKDLKPLFILGNNILRLRMGAGWSQSELAKRVGTKQTNISKIENGLSNPTYKFLLKVAETFSINVAELVKEDLTEIRSRESSEITRTRVLVLNPPGMPNPYKNVVVDNSLAH